MFYSLWLRSERKPIRRQYIEVFLFGKESWTKGHYHIRLLLLSDLPKSPTGHEDSGPLPSAHGYSQLSSPNLQVHLASPKLTLTSYFLCSDHIGLLPKLLLHQTNLVLNALPFAVPSPRCLYPPCLISIRVLSSVYLLSET